MIENVHKYDYDILMFENVYISDSLLADLLQIVKKKRVQS